MAKRTVTDARSAHGEQRATAARKSSKRILVGIRLEERLVKVMKGLAELKDCTLGQLVEEVFLNAIEGRSAFAKNNKVPADVRQQISGLKKVYGLTYSADHLDMAEAETTRRKRRS